MQSSDWENEKIVLCQALGKRLFKNKTQVTYEELSNAGLPSFLKSYLKSQVKRYFETEKPLVFITKDRYQSKDTKIQDLTNQLINALQNATLFTEKEISEVMDRTIGLQIDFLLKPRDVLERIFFKTKESREHSEILHAIIGISDDRPFLRHLIQILRNINQKNISKELFIRVTKEAEEEIYRQKPISAFIQDVVAFLNFKGQILGESSKRIHKNLLPSMLKERNLTYLAESLMTYSNSGNPGEQFIEIPELEKLLESYLYRDESEAKKKETKTIAATNKNDKNILTSDNDMTIEMSFAHSLEEGTTGIFDEGKDAVDLSSDQTIKFETKKNHVFFGSSSSPVIGSEGDLKLTKKDNEPPEIKKPKIVYQDEPVKPLTKKSSIFGRSVHDNETRKIDRKLLEAQPDGPIQNLRSLIDARSKKIFVKKIFNKNEVAYNIFISKIESENTWKEAKMQIDHELARLKIDPFSREAIKLGDLVFSRYFPKNSK